jgi:predicted Zn finger-like uncharacterized protein
MKITCPNCQKKYAVKEAKLPPGVKNAQCKACGQMIPLKQAPEKPAAKPVEPPEGKNDLIRFRCAGCGKKYKIDRNKIPPNLMTVKCKVCESKIPLPQEEAGKTADGSIQQAGHPEHPAPSIPNLVSEETPLPVSRPRKKKWLFAAAACVLLAGILGVLAHFNIIGLDGLKQYIPGSAEKAAESSQILTAATIGQFFAGSTDLSPTAGKVETRYAPEPNFVTTVDTDQLKMKIPQLIKDSLFPSQYWDRVDKPQMTLNLDTIDLPNAALAEMTYEVKSIKSPDGREVLRVEESKFKPRVLPGSFYPGNISLNVKTGTSPDDLAKASIYFDLTVPVALEVFAFAAEDQPGSARETAGVRVTLGRLEKDVARVSSSGGKSMRLIAYDKTGRALASRESMSTPSSISTRFEGIISSLKVVVTRKIFESPFEIEVDLNQGKELVLSRQPEVPVRMRYNLHPIPTYVNFTADELKDLAVVWTEGREGSWNDSLSIKLPQGPFSGHAVWEAHFFGSNKPRLLNGSAAQSTRDFSFTLEKDKLKQANAAFGKVHLNLHTDISRLIYAPKNGSQPAPQVLPSGNPVSVEFNQNEITYSTGHANVIQTVAYDARGKRLKQDQYTRNKGGKRAIYFWGLPAKFEIDVAVNTLEEVIPFEIRQRPLDEKAYRAFKLTIKNHRDVVQTIKTIDRARRKDRSYYGDDLAGLFYLYPGKQKKPQNLITQEIAHSDPAGQERFGYKVQPYRGYYFTVLSGVENSGVKKEYNRRSKKSRFSWQKGTITTTSLTRHPDLVAIPEDESQPTFFLQWGQVFMKPLSGEELKYLPDGYYNKGWVEARYIDN